VFIVSSDSLFLEQKQIELIVGIYFRHLWCVFIMSTVTILQYSYQHCLEPLSQLMGGGRAHVGMSKREINYFYVKNPGVMKVRTLGSKRLVMEAYPAVVEVTLD
jgi:hypothetical protein